MTEDRERCEFAAGCRPSSVDGAIDGKADFPLQGDAAARNFRVLAHARGGRRVGLGQGVRHFAAMALEFAAWQGDAQGCAAGAAAAADWKGIGHRS